MPVFNTANAVDYALIVLYFVIVIWIGFYAARKNKGADDFFKASGQVPWFVAGVSSWVSGFSAFMFVAAAGFTYKNGASTALLFTAATWAYLGGYFYFAPMWRRARIDAPLQFLTRRYSSSTTYFYTVTAILPQVIGIGQGLYILCIFVSTALGFEREVFHLFGREFTGIELSMLVVGAVMILYSVAGGLWAAVLSDAVQGLIILIMSVVVFPVTFLYLGKGHGGGIGTGLRRLFEELPHEYLVPIGQSVQPLFLLSYALSSFLGYNVAWHFAQRYNSVPSERDAKKMALLGAALSLFGPLLWLLPVMGARLIFPDMAALWPNLKAPEEASFVSLAMLLLPHGMVGFVIAAILSATLGQANDAFNWLAAAVTRDVYMPLRRTLGCAEISDRHQLWTARLTMLVIGISGVATSFAIAKRGGAFDFGLKYYSIVGPGFMMPVFLGMVYRKTPWWSGIASCVASFTTTFSLIAVDAWPTHVYERNILSAIIASTAVFALSAWFYNADDPASAEARRLDEDFRTPVPEEANGKLGGSLAVYGVIGNLSLILGAVLAACTFLPSTADAPARINLIAGLLLIAIGFGLRKLATLGRRGG
jgi:Na+/proline symporter